MDVFQMGADPIRFMSSVDSESTTADDLLTVDYTRAQKASPEFLTVYEGIDQNIDVKISTFVFKAAPEAVLMLYDFIMTTFVPDTGNNAEQQDSTVNLGGRLGGVTTNDIGLPGEPKLCCLPASAL